MSIVDLAWDETTGDLALDANGAPALVEGPAAIAQHLCFRLDLGRGEWFLDEAVGLPFFETIFEKGTPLATIRAIYRQVIAETPGVLEIERLDVSTDPSTRLGRVSFRARVEGGVVEIDPDGNVVVEVT